jgi:hypothetical protein
MEVGCPRLRWQAEDRGSEALNNLNWVMAGPISVAGFALSLAKTAGEQLNKLRERAQVSKDLEVKKHVSNLYDTVLELKEALSHLVDEKKELTLKLEQQAHPPETPKIRQVGETQYHFLEEDGPLLPSLQ